jgi:hypothetical protein
MAADRSAAELERFLAERADHLLCTAVLLAGGREAGEDLLQTAVERPVRHGRGRPDRHLRMRAVHARQRTFGSRHWYCQRWSRQRWYRRPAASLVRGLPDV